LKLLLDEMYPALIAEELRRLGHDVISVHAAPGRGTPDEEVFEFAGAEGRAVVTENVSDFRPLAEAVLATAGHPAGVAFTTDKRWPRSDPGGLINALDELLKASADQPLDSELWL
jgi:predicted nuclease of predicted toxin-antitoxin system